VAVFVFVIAAPVLGLLALLWRRASPAFRHGQLLFSGLGSCAALEYFGTCVDAWRVAAVQPEVRTSLAATPATWCARIVWACLAGAAAISWWRWPKPHRATPVDPKVFE
jgi:hypothetical protein